MLADEGRGLENGEDGGGLGDGAEGGVVDALEPEVGVEVGGALEEGLVGGGIGTYDDLRTLAGGEFRFGGFSAGFYAADFLGVVDAVADFTHGFAGAFEGFFGGEFFEGFFVGEFDVDGDAVSELAGFFDECDGGFGDGFEVDVAAEVVVFAEGAGDFDDHFHGVVGIADDAGGEEEAFDVVSFVEVEGEFDDFGWGEGGALDVGGAAVDAVVAVVEAAVCEEDFEEGDAAAIRGVGVADAGASGGADSGAGGGVFFCGSGAGAGGVVLGGVG